MSDKHSRYLHKPFARLLVAIFVALNIGIVAYGRKESSAKSEPSTRVAQSQTPAPEGPAGVGLQVNPSPSQPVAVDAGNISYLSEREFQLTLLVAVIAVSTLLMQFLLLKKSSKLKSEDTSRVFGMTLIITGTLFSLTAGFSSEQIAPAVGLFGTIAGYLLGRGERKEREDHA